MPALGRRGVLAAACGITAVLGAGILQPAAAGSATARLGVSLTITAGCTVLAPSIGATPRMPPANPAVNVNCTTSVPYSMTRYSVLDIAPNAKGVVLTVIY